jgi:hypothetical protein
MRCSNCGKKIPKDARVCQYCEAAVEAEPSEEEKAAMSDLLEQMPPEALDELRAIFDESETAEEFADRIFVGDCPKCGSSDTGNCENDPEIGELLVGRCYQCGQLWCTECLQLLKPDSPSCPCWDEDPSEDEEWDDGEEEWDEP